MTSRSGLVAVACAAALVASCSTAPSDEGAGEAVHSSATTRTPSDVSPSVPASDPPSASPESAAPSPTRSAGDAAAPLPGPTQAHTRQARRIVDRMPLQHLAGQVIVAEYDGLTAPAGLVNDLHLGGVIVMGDNIGTTEALRRSNTRLKAAVREAGRDWPLFIGVDQEGGVVERVKDRATRFPAFMSAGAARDLALTARAAAASGAELRALGFTVVFAPSADVTSGPADPTIGSRSASSRPAVVARQATAAARGYLDAGILPVVKHFPGHGSVPADSHVELPVQRQSLPQLRRTDLVPFRAGAQAGVPAVMVGHLDVRAVHPRTPSTLSRPVVTGLLRRDLGYRGLVVTDAMNMGAITQRQRSGEAAVRTLAAGVDVVLMPPSPRAARDGIVDAVRSGRLSRARLEQAATRQIATLLHRRSLEPVVTRAPGTSGRASYRLSAGAATVVSGPCRGRLVGPAVQATGPEAAVARFNAAARRAGLRTGSGTSVALIGYSGSARSADVVVSTDTPYALGASTARVARIAMYGDTPGAMRALVRVLLGKARAPGRLPVPVPGVPRPGC